mmetsp:Transcript_36115/g.44049  ORF Transcript_36115/g.44049 Transcript_36115/m.44049 type:complete len:93 (-) Transcript_36115:257-535(-)
MKLRAPRPRTAKNSSSYFDRFNSHGSTGAQETTFDRTDYLLANSATKKTTIVDLGDVLRFDSHELNNQLSLIALIHQSNKDLEAAAQNNMFQ